MNETKYLTPSAVNKYIKVILEQNNYLKNMSITGEISNFKSSSGHFYFSIKDENAQISCVMFKNNTFNLDFAPKDGLLVNIVGNIYHNVKTGFYSINVKAMEEHGKGDLQRKFEELKNKLEMQGFFDQAHKQEINPFNQRIALVTAPTSAAIKDMISTIKRRNPIANIIIVPTIVQGNKAVNSIVNSIKYVNDNNLADVMIVGRGGGSIEDLWAFNEEPVAQAVFDSKIPIISSVGHETDFTIIDFVADKRAATPTAAGEFVTIDLFEKNQQMENMIKQLANLLMNKIQFQSLNLAKLVENQYFQDPFLNIKFNYDNLLNEFKNNAINRKLMIKHQHEKIDDLDYQLKKSAKQIINDKENQLEVLHTNLDNLNPLSILSRGYGAFFQNDQPINVDKLQKDDQFEIISKNKKIKSQVLDIEVNDEFNI